jgi:hypothetical protein
MNRNIAQNITELLGNTPIVTFRTIGLQTPRVLQRQCHKVNGKVLNSYDAPFWQFYVFVQIYAQV